MEIFFFLFFYFKIFYSNCDCINYDNDINCGNGINYYKEWDDQCFQTPPKTDIFSNYKNSYQDMHYLVGYAQLKYNPDKTECTINFIKKVNPKLGKEGINYKLIYKFGDSEQEENSFKAQSKNSYPDGLSISAKIIDFYDNNKILSKLELENVYFLWDNPKITLNNKYENGQKGVIVELFGWPYEDISEECQFLSIAGYLGVKIAPPNESILNTDFYDNGELNPWWYLYQPVSYKLESRIGNKKQLKAMTKKCREKNVRIYSEVVINNMVANGNDVYEIHYNNNCTNIYGSRKGSAGSPFWTTKGQYFNNIYTGLKPTFEFPSVPYCGSDFHCYRDVINNNYNSINYGWINNLVDLRTESDYVRQRIADFFTELLSIGISGFIINNSKYINPNDFLYIFMYFKQNLGNVEFPDDFIIILELYVGMEKDMLLCNSEENYSFSKGLYKKLKDANFTENDINKIKIWTEDYPNKLPNCSENEYAINMSRHVISLENREDMKIESKSSYSYQYIRNIDIHRKYYTDFIKRSDLEWKIKIVFSAYSLINGAIGFPDGKSDCDLNCTKSVPYVKAYEPYSIGYDTKEGINWIEGNYTRIHRDFEIVRAMREWIGLEDINQKKLYKYDIKKQNRKIEEITTNECDEKCSSCDNESNKKKLCKACNTDNGFFPIIYDNQNISQEFFECLKYGENHTRFYFDNTNNEYKPCYETCKTCIKGGNPINHNCQTCEINYIFRPNNSSNCVTNCEYNYYISKFGQYKCTEAPICPEESKLIIKERNKCTDDCSKDSIYKYQYNGYCIRECPKDTINVSFVCQENNQKCTLIEEDIKLNITDINKGMQTIAKAYSKEFSYTNNHVSKYKNNEYKILFYKNDECLKQLSIEMSKVDFGECYKKLQNHEKINEELLLIAIVEKINPINPITFYAFFNPKTGDKIDAETICKNEEIIIEENITNLLNEDQTNLKTILFLTGQNINIFNISNEFYQDICFHFESPINKDIPLKDRLLAFYPNITLCDPGCENKGVNIQEMSAICKCAFNDIANNDLIKENALLNNMIGEVLEIINESNILVITCYKYIFKYFDKSYGGFISLFLLLANIILTFVFWCYDMKNIKKYIFTQAENYITYLSSLSKQLNNDVNNKKEPPKKKLKNSIKQLNSFKNETEENKNGLCTENKKLRISFKKSNFSSNLLKSIQIQNKIDKIVIDKETIKNKDNNYDSYFTHYLSTQIEDMDYDDAIKKDNRVFCIYFFESLKEKQIIANTFFAIDPLRTRSIKIMLFILDIILYFVVNGLFFSEDYVSEVYNLEEEETFFSFVPRSINRFFYTTLVSLVVSFIIDCIFVEEKKIKGIFLREKDNTINIKSEITIFMKEIQNRYLTFILIVYFILIISFYYLLCFNYVYPHMQIEWIKSSIIIMIINQIISIIRILLESVLRYISFSCKSEKIYKASKLLS